MNIQIFHYASDKDSYHQATGYIPLKYKKVLYSNTPILLVNSKILVIGLMISSTLLSLLNILILK